MQDLISRQAAIIQLSHNKNGDDDHDVIVQKDIETIKQLPSAQQDFGIDQKINKAYDDGYDQGYLQCREDQERITGHWIEITNNRGTVIALRCSCCKKSPKHAIKSDFCPNCGSPMEGVVYDV